MFVWNSYAECVPCSALELTTMRLESSARVFSSPLDDVPELVTTQAERLKEIDKSRRRLEAELAELRGRTLHSSTEPDDRRPEDSIPDAASRAIS